MIAEVQKMKVMSVKIMMARSVLYGMCSLLETFEIWTKAFDTQSSA